MDELPAPHAEPVADLNDGLGPLFDDETPKKPALTHAQVAAFRSAAVRALHDYRNALVLIDAKAPALDRVSNALTALGA